MNSRISTGQMFTQSLSTMLTRQNDLQHLQQQLATGQKIVTAKDDPVASGTAVSLDRAVAELERFGQNANTVQNRLGLQESVLAQAGDQMARVSELTIQANGGALSDEDRKAIATELASIRESMLSLANSSDGNGRFLFGGAADDSAPFSRVNGQVVYNGDQTQRKVEIAPETFVTDTLPGSEVFLRVRTGDGTVDASASAANTGTGMLGDFGRSTAGGWNGENYQLVFTAADTYEVRDAANAVVSTGTYQSGEDIAFGGLHMRITGAPAAGDSFAIAPAGTRDVFATLDTLIQTLGTAAATPAEVAARQNALQSSLRDVAGASDRMIDARASGGAQLAAIDDATALREANSVTLKETLSGLRDLDYADAITRVQLESTALQAAQAVFTQMQGMSLFSRL